ncbi:MAG: hypothetical protein FWE19_05365 [Oscillospiraceae bacterium]|nr:hypothetical protein [Oscillospiraceae bacterium]
MAVMTGLAFVYVALPVAVALYLLFPAGARPGALLGFSLAYYLLVGPEMLPYMLAVAAADLAALAIMARYDHNQKTREACLIFSVAKNLGAILVFQGMATRWQAGPETALGLYVVTLSGLGCVLEAYRRQIPKDINPIHFALYCFFFPRLAAGPLITYRDFVPQLEQSGATPGQMGKGFCIFLQGAVKFRLLGEGLHIFYDTLRHIPPEEVSVLGVWTGILALGLSVYLRFSGCADMARGIGGMLGLTLPKNFDYPYQAKSVGDFFARFNFSLTGYIREVLGPRYADGLIGLLVVGVASGLWFGLSVGRLVWGIYLALFLLLERRLYPGFVKRAHPVFGRVYALTVILLSFAMFGANSLGEIAQTVTIMFGFGDLPLQSDRLGYLLASNRLLLIAGVILATSALTKTGAFLKTRIPAGATAVLAFIASLILLVLLSAFLL